MLKSMTGFGTAETQTEGLHVKVEIKTLNSKFQDVNIKLPKELTDKEGEIKLELSNSLQRGKISCAIDLALGEELEAPISINEALFRKYFDRYSELAEQVNGDTTEIFRLALQSPDVVNQADLSGSLDYDIVKSTLKEAIQACDHFRISEGASLTDNFKDYINEIRKGLEEVKKQDPKRVDQIRSRLSQHMDQVKDKVALDANRFEQEIIFYLEKLDITEEKVRLERHLEYFLEVMKESESQGKKLGFISQEIGREINTIGAKANDAIIQRAVVKMKDELEKIKEQSMNIL